MKKNLKKPLKSLMLTAMALLTATATAVNATSYVTIKVEHIWEDNNNAYGTRPDDVKVDINQVQWDKDEGKFKPTQDKPFTDVTDNGSSAGETAGNSAAEEGMTKDQLLQEIEEKGKEAGERAGADAKEKLDGLDLKNPDEVKKPDDWVNPDDLPKPEDLKDFKGEDGKDYHYSESEKAAYKAKLEEYRQAYEQYRGSEDQEGSYAAYKKAYEGFQEYLKEYCKAENSVSRPGGNDSGFTGGFIAGFGQDSGLTEDELKTAYNKGFDKGYGDGYSGAVTPEPLPDDGRDELVENIGKEIDGLVDGKGEETAKDILEKVDAIISGSEDLNVKKPDAENVWLEEEELGKGDEKNDKGALNYRADMEDHPVEAKKDFLESLGLDEKTLDDVGYTSKQLKIEITIVKGDDAEARVYVSVDGGNTFTGVNTDVEYDELNDVLDEVKFTFLHTLNVPYAPPEFDEIDGKEPPAPPKPHGSKDSDDRDRDPRDPKDPEEPEIPDGDVPLAEEPEAPEEEPEEVEIPEEDVPLSEIPKTGDSSLLWMFAAMLSGTALLALLKKEREAQEA